MGEGGGGGGGGGIYPPLDQTLEFEKTKLLSVKPQETLVVSLGMHDITNSILG